VFIRVNSWFRGLRPFDYAQGTLFGEKRDLKKQSQFAGGENEYKLNYNKEL
jgi:hypothetical protein